LLVAPEARGWAGIGRSFFTRVLRFHAGYALGMVMPRWRMYLPERSA
jgi:hypothetical protein